jgi:hypothetical protein
VPVEADACPAAACVDSSNVPSAMTAVREEMDIVDMEEVN